MKKFLSVILCTLLTVSVAACGGSGKDSSKKKESVETAEKRAHELEEENEHLKATKEKLEEARACILPEEVRQKFYGIAFDKKYKAQAEAMTAAERMAEAVECGENARQDAIRYRAMTEEVKEWKDIIKLLDNIARKQAGR